MRSFLTGAVWTVAMVVLGTTMALAQTQIIAHRGYWQTPGSAQNSITALYNAQGIGIYGSEMDVQLSADDEVMVNHDASIQGHVIAQTTADSLLLLRLENGEPLPTLRTYLGALRCCPGLKLILEIKPHAIPREEELAARLVADQVRAYGLGARTEYISFSRYICQQLVALVPDGVVSYLGSDVAPATLAAEGIRGIDYHYSVLLKHPEWVSEAHQQGMVVNAWTVNDLQLARQLIGLGVDYITTDIPVEMRKLTNE